MIKFCAEWLRTNGKIWGNFDNCHKDFHDDSLKFSLFSFHCSHLFPVILSSQSWWMFVSSMMMTPTQIFYMTILIAYSCSFILCRASDDHGKLATIYKSEKRSEMVKEGYRILGNSGDQWSDLLGSAISNRSFKLPNPMYYIPWH